MLQSSDLRVHDESKERGTFLTLCQVLGEKIWKVSRPIYKGG